MSDDAPDYLSEALLSAALFFAAFAFGTTEEWSKGALCLMSFCLLFRAFSRYGLSVFSPPTAPPAAFAALTLLACAVLQSSRTAQADALALASGPFTVSRHLTWSFALEWASFFSVLIAAPSVYSKQGALERLAWTLLSLGAILAVVGVAQQQAGNTHYLGIRAVSPLRVPFGPFPNKNHAGSLLALTFCAGVGTLSAILFRRRRSNHPYPIDEAVGRSLIVISLLGVVAGGIVWARSRGAQLALGASFLLAAGFATLKPGSTIKERLAWAAPLFGLTAAALFFGRSWSSVAEFLRPDALQSPAYRMTWIREALAAALDFPLFGVGLGAYRVVAPLYHDLVDGAYVVDFAHCDPIQLAVEGGIPLALALYASIAWTIIKASPLGGEDGGVRGVRFGLTLAIGTVLLHQLVDFPSRIPGVQFAFVAVLAALWGSSPEFRPRPSAGAPWRIKALLAGAMAVVWVPHYVPELGGTYFDFMASRTIPPATHYYRNAALKWAPTFTRHHAMALEYSRSADENPAASVILQRKALKHADQALDREPYQPNVRQLKANLLMKLGRPEDARAALGLP